MKGIQKMINFTDYCSITPSLVPNNLANSVLNFRTWSICSWTCRWGKIAFFLLLTILQNFKRYTFSCSNKFRFNWKYREIDRNNKNRMSDIVIITGGGGLHFPLFLTKISWNRMKKFSMELIDLVKKCKLFSRIFPI